MPLDFAPSEEQQLARQAVLDLLRPFAPRADELRRQIMKEKRFPQEVWDAMAEAGFLGCLIPEAYGGTALGLVALTTIVETLASQGFANALLILTAMDSLCILRNGSEDLKQRTLPPIARGELKLCFALTEPNAGSNTFRLETVARRAGDTYRITGQKTFITGADVADAMLLVARTTPLSEVEARGLPKAFGLALFLVPTKAAGVTLRPIPTRGIEGMTQFEIFLEDVEVPAADLVGDPDGGVMALFNSLNPERILASATACGMTELLLGKSVAYASERRVFKERPIGAYQAVQHPLAEVRIELEASRLLTYKAAWAFDRGLPPGEVGLWANMAKHKASETAILAADRAIQTHGGYGFSEEYGVVWYWEAARLLRTAPISRELVLNYVAEHGLGLPRSY